LIDLVADCKTTIPPYCRVNRVMRDIPAGNIVAGSTKSNLRQLAQQRLKERGLACKCIRCREVRGRPVSPSSLHRDELAYRTDVTEEHFIQFLTQDNRLAGFLRLSLPDAGVQPVVDELAGHAVIRQVHVYGPALAVSSASQGEAQHSGLGGELIRRAIEITGAKGYRRLAVISAVGTRDYYRKHGFELGDLYMSRTIDR
jgi:elongator complex protein 3